ncbi:hypothetical protein [Brevibacillus laterosporus]|uniref:hypothetical protein n=1 Tax=Brevibacillus laterosporus TaxID=1465 RepID=UPI00264D7D66|nr:hypothetical protein [Brevibacillus laterosporus]MDN9008469.1 hypothetical protein [Brevibacillus laterosporus]MDO0939554.1 hypothetical protein [Brevibacillus laterosporus]
MTMLKITPPVRVQQKGAEPRQAFIYFRGVLLRLEEFWCCDGLLLERQLVKQVNLLVSGNEFNIDPYPIDNFLK